MIDCSHDNSNQDYRNQGKVIEDIKSQITLGNKSIFGVMLESNLFSGKQKILSDKQSMKYGVSVTDGCIDWDETESVIKSLQRSEIITFYWPRSLIHLEAVSCKSGITFFIIVILSNRLGVRPLM